MNEASAADFAGRAVLRLSAIEFWERYSFYTTFALLALFVSASVASGGMGWSNAQSLRFFGAYLLAVQITPILGGYLADRHIRKRTALGFGAVALLLGHGLLALSAALPLAEAGGSGKTLFALVAESDGWLGSWTPPAGLPASAASIYLATTACFYGGVVLIAAGNGLFKPILTVAVGRLPHANEAARTAAFTTFFLYINVGGLLSIVLGGWLATRFGWGFAFGGSAIGMVFAIATMLALEARYLKPFLDQPAATAGARGSGGGVPNFRAAIAALLLLLVLCSCFSFQSYGFVSLFTAQFVDRTMGGFEIPPSWFTALNPITIMALSPLLIRAWRRGGTGADWTTVQHMAAALLLMGLGFIPLIAAAVTAQGGLAHPSWIAATIMLIAASEVLYAPAALAAATRIAPANLQTIAVGSQGAAIGVGAWFSGQIGALAFETDKVAVMAAVAIAAAAASGILFTARRQFARFGL